MPHYNYLVIGGGSAGLASAKRAQEHGATVALIEKKDLGGTCVNRGCVPKKVMHIAAELGDEIKIAKESGWNIPTHTIDWPKFMEKTQAYITRLNGIFDKQLKDRSIKFYEGTAQFIDSKTIKVGGTTLTADHILIATGGRPHRLEFPGHEHAITSDDFFHLPHQPKHATIIGAGYIAVEFAGILASLGTKVTLVVRGTRILKRFDDEIVDHLTDHLQSHNIEILFESNITAIEKKGNGEFTTTIEVKGKEEKQETNLVIMATGRKPNTCDLGLENTSITLSERGDILTDDHDQTEEKNIYALGDVTRHLQLTPTAIKAGRLLADRLFNKGTKHMDYTNVPTAIFATLEIGTCGLTTKEAEEKFGKKEVKTYRSAFNPMHYALSETKVKSIMKMVTQGPEEKVVGIHLIGPQSAEIMQGFALAVRHNLPKSMVDDVVAIHPTIAEELVLMR